MLRINDREVELTDAEEIVREWHISLMDVGLSQADALKEIEDSVPQDGAVIKVLEDAGFRAYLLT